MILSRAEARTLHLVEESFAILFRLICSLYLICSLRFSKSFSRSGENLMRTVISPSGVHYIRKHFRRSYDVLYT